MDHSSYLISTNRSNEGLQIIELIRDPNFKRSTWYKIGDKYSQLHNLRLALQFSKNIDDTDYQNKFLHGVVKNIDFGLVDVIEAGLMGLLFSINLKVCFLIIPNFIENHVGYFLMNFQDYFGYFNH